MDFHEGIVHFLDDLGGEILERILSGGRDAVHGAGAVIGGTLPGGRYASLTHTGPYRELKDASMALDAWVRTQGYQLDGREEAGGLAGATRLEIYEDPGQTPSGHPVTQVAFRLAE